MPKDSVDTQMDEHLANVQYEIKAALDVFRKSGKKFTRKFMEHFQNATFDRIKQTCARYPNEAQWKKEDEKKKKKRPNTADTVHSQTNPNDNKNGNDKRQSEMIHMEVKKKQKVTERHSNITDTKAKPSGDKHSKAKPSDDKNAVIDLGRGNGKRQSDTIHTEMKKKQKVTERHSNTTDTKHSKAKSNDNKNGNVKNNHDHQNFKYITFFCFYCLDQNDCSVTKSFSGTIDDVYGHWLAKHAHESISKPFKFCAATSMGCFHCKHIGIYHDLVKHHNEKHSEQQFAIVNRRDRNMCGVCHFKDGDMIEHFKMKHALKSMPKMVNPIYYSEKRISELLKINVHKKHQCNECNGIFETQNGITEHFKIAHNGRAVQSKEFVHNRSTPDHLICGYCQEKVDCTQLLSHFRGHSYNLKCPKCTYQTGDMSELICHGKYIHDIDDLNYSCVSFPGWVKGIYFNTDMVFGNGLTLKLFNVLETKFDFSQSFDVSVLEFLELQKEHAKRMIALKVTLVNTENTSTPQTEEVLTVSSVPPAPSQAISTVTSNEQQSAVPSEDIIHELNEQRKLANNIYIHGITPEISTNMGNSYEAFKRFCSFLNVNVNLSQIEYIQQLRSGIVVGFHQVNQKILFLSQTSSLWFWSDYLCFLPNRQTPWKIFVRNHTTPFYQSIQSAAAQFKKQHRLHSFKLKENGFLVKITANGIEHVVQSKQQLMDLVKKN